MSKKAASIAGLSEEKIADLKEAFAMFDINGDGRSWDNDFLLWRVDFALCLGTITNNLFILPYDLF